MLEFERKLKLARIACGVVIVHVMMGIYQERILRQPYVIQNNSVPGNFSREENSTLFSAHNASETTKERFTYAFSLVGVQCFVYSLVAKGAIITYRHEANETPQKYFLLPAIFYVLAMVTSNMALQWVPYTTQVIGKASKPISVMFLSVLIAGKSYRPQKYVFVLVIVLALILFSYKDQYDKKDGEDPLKGTALIGISLVMDGMMAALQDKMRTASRPTSLNLMYYLNAWSSLYLAILIALRGEAMKFFSFCTRHPAIVFHLGILVSLGSLGQFFIARMISNFGALPLSIVMTIRKFISVFLSVLVYNNEMSTRKWLATAIIFLALICDSVYQLRSSPTPSSSTPDTERTESESSEESELNNQKSLNLSSVLIDKEFNGTVKGGGQVEHDKCEACEKCCAKVND